MINYQINKYQAALFKLQQPKFFDEILILKELVDKATPKKVIYEPQALGRGFKQLCCPVCFSEATGHDYCWGCGQVLEPNKDE